MSNAWSVFYWFGTGRVHQSVVIKEAMVNKSAVMTTSEVATQMHSL